MRNFLKNINKFAALAILMVGIAAMSFKVSPVKAHSDPSLYWYPVNSATNETTAAEQFNDTKSNVISAQGCKDDTNQPICLFGSTDSNLAIGTDVGTPSADDRILKTDN